MPEKHSDHAYDRLKVGLGVGLPLGLLALVGLLILCCRNRKRRRAGRAAVRLEDLLKSPRRRAAWDAAEEEHPGDVPLGAVVVAAAEGDRAASPDLEAGGRHRRLSFERREEERRVDDYVEHSPESTDDDDLPPAPSTLLPTWRASLPSSSGSRAPGIVATVPGIDDDAASMTGGAEERRNVTMILGGGGLSAAAQAATVDDELPPATLLPTAWRASVPSASASGSRAPGPAATVPSVDEYMAAAIIPGCGEDERRMNVAVILGGEGLAAAPAQAVATEDDELAPHPPPRPSATAPPYAAEGLPEHDEGLWGPPGERIPPSAPPDSSSSSSSPPSCSCVDTLFEYVFAAE